MTPEEQAKQVAREIYDKAALHDRQSGYALFHPDHWQPIAAAIASAAAASRRAALEEAAKTDCQLCHDGMGVYHYVNGEIDEWFHAVTPTNRVVCKAGHIWRLTDIARRAAPGDAAASPPDGTETNPKPAQQSPKA